MKKKNNTALGSSFDEHLLLELRNPVFAAAFIKDAMEDGDQSYLKIALLKVVQAYGVNAVAERTGITRTAIYKMLSQEGNPSLENVQLILSACNLKIQILPENDSARLKPRVYDIRPGKVVRKSKSIKTKKRESPEDRLKRLTNETHIISKMASRSVKIASRSSKKATSKKA